MTSLSTTSASVDAVKGATLKERAQMVLATLGRTPAEINRAFRRLAKLHHPDVRGGDAVKFKLINEACVLLLEGKISRNPLLADAELVLRMTGRRAAPLLNYQQIWEAYQRWHEQRFHAGDWFYPGAPDAGRRVRRTQTNSRRNHAV